MKRKINIYLIIIFIISLALRFPLENTILSDFDQLHNFNQGARLLNTSLFKINPWYKNTFTNIFILGNQGISGYFLSFFNIFILKVFNIKVQWWSYFLFYILLDIINTFLLYFLIELVTKNKFISFLSSLLYLTMPVFIYNSVMRPCWLIYSVFWELLFFYSLFNFYFKRNIKFFYFSSFPLTFIILGDTNFFNILLVSAILIYFLGKNHFVTLKEILKFFILPIISLSINIFFSAIAIYKGYFLGLFGYFIGHFFSSSLNTSKYPDFFDYFYNFLLAHGPLFIIHIILFFIFILKKDKKFIEMIILLWNAILIFSVLFLKRLDAVVGLYFVPSIILIAMYMKNMQRKLFKIFIIFLLFIALFQGLLSFDMKYSKFNIYKFIDRPFINKNFGQMAAGYWIRKNTTLNDSVIVITPKYNLKKLQFASPKYIQSSELYFKKIYTYCKGEAPKKLFSIVNIFNNKILYNINNPPKIIVDYSGDNNNFLKLKETMSFPVDKYMVCAIIKDRDKVITKIYKKNYSGSLKIFDKNKLEYLFIKEFGSIDNFVFSPYQGLWVYIP